MPCMTSLLKSNMDRFIAQEFVLQSPKLALLKSNMDRFIVEITSLTEY